MKRTLPTIIFIFFFLIGLSLMLYPSVSNRWNSLHASRAIVNYDSALKNLSDEDYTQMLQKAEAYNEAITKIDFPFLYHDQVAGYTQLLDIDGSGIMGYITIGKIRVRLPIYHGTSEGVLQKGVGHLTGSSLPIGGEGNHTVLSAHRGLPSAKLFTDLDRMQAGDRFFLSILDQELCYEVDQILTVEPQEVEALLPVEDADLCTLITCTPYGVNSHRLLVRGRRVIPEQVPAVIPADGRLLPHYTAAPALALPVMLILILRWSVQIVGRKKYEKTDVSIGTGLGNDDIRQRT